MIKESKLPKVLEQVRPFNHEQERQIKEKPLEDIRPYLNELAQWRRDCLASWYRN